MDTSYDAYRMLITTTIGHQLRNQKNCPIYTRIYCPDKSYSLSNHSRIACPVWPVIRIPLFPFSLFLPLTNMKMNRKNIFAIDSGIGGLSVLASWLRQLNHGFSITYMADFANIPYGNKNPEKIKEIIQENLVYLLEMCAIKNVPDLIFIACNTIFANAKEVCTNFGKSSGVPVCGVIHANCLDAISKNPKRIIVIATAATVKSHTYRIELEKLSFKSSKIIEIACPLFVSFIEESLTTGPALEWVINHYIRDVVKPGDAVILGCTHYYYILETLKSLFPKVIWIRSGKNLMQYEPAVKTIFNTVSEGLSCKRIQSSLNLVVTGREFELSSIKALNLKNVNVNSKVITSVKRGT